MAINRDVRFRYFGEDSGFSRVSRRVESSLGQVTKRAVSFNSVFAVAAGSFAATQVFGQIADAVGTAITAFGEQEEALESLRASLAATGKAGADNLKLLTDESFRLQLATRQGDDAIQAATASLAQLVPSLDINGLKDAQTAVVALAETFFDGKLDQAALQLGKTLGSTTNALSRYGISIENSAAPASEKLQEILGDGKLKAAFEVAQAKATTLNGRLAQLGNAAGDVREALGGVIARTLDLSSNAGGLTERLLGVAQSIEENMNQWVLWGRVVVEATLLVGQAIASVIRLAFNLGQAFGSLILALERFGAGDFEGAKRGFAGIGDAASDMGDALGDVGRRAISFMDSIVAAQNEVNVLGEAGRTVASVLGGALEGVGGEADEATKALAKLNEQLQEASRSVLLQLTAEEQMRRTRVEFGLAADGVRTLRQALIEAGPAGTAIAAPFQIATKAIEAMGDAAVRVASTMEVATLAFSDAFADSIVDATTQGAEAFSRFAASVLEDLAKISARILIFQALGSIFNFSTGGFGNLFRSALGFDSLTRQGDSVRVAGAAPSLATAGAPLDFSSFPPARNSLEGARDRDWQAFLSASQGFGRANGYRYS